MQKLIQLLDEIRGATRLADEALIHYVREYLQISVLKAMYRSKYGHALSFMGGTCLRICYGLKRYSEDLDFALDRPLDGYSFPALVRMIAAETGSRGFDVETTIDEKLTVHKSFIKFSNLLYPMKLSHRKDHKLQIKLEVDTKPIPVTDDELESHFVAKYDEIFPLLKHKNETLFAGKILALLCRAYTKGRDYYDLIWFLARGIKIDFRYLNNGIKQASASGRMAKHPPFESFGEVVEELRTIIEKSDPKVVMRDIGRFLEDPAEENWIKDYRKLFEQLAKGYHSK